MKGIASYYLSIWTLPEFTASIVHARWRIDEMVMTCCADASAEYCDCRRAALRYLPNSEGEIHKRSSASALHAAAYTLNGDID